MTCRGKVRYATKGAAERIVDQARDRRKHGAQHRQERRVYHCQVCKGWHTTQHEWHRPLDTDYPNEAA